jgi:hypothetical protein
MQAALTFMEAHEDDENKQEFGTLEVDKFRRVVRYMETTEYSEDKILEGRRDFHAWFTEHDRRRNTNFTATFPELTNFYQGCSKL